MILVPLVGRVIITVCRLGFLDFAAFYLGVDLLHSLRFVAICGDAVPAPLQTFFEEKSLTKNLFALACLLLFFCLS